MSGISVSTIKAPEFVNITSISPLISKCEIKVLYVGANRNRSFITKEVAKEMAQSLPGTPIVGYYSENKEDFGDHGEQMVIDGDGIKFNCLTKPYGFVPLDSKVWFKEFEDTDEFGNKEVREYLMCEGYLWTEQYEEAKKVINEGRPHSMELDDKTRKGHWSTDNNRGIEFFIINDAIFSKLCILGEAVEPCFEGSSVTAPEVSSAFTADNNDFVKTLFTMMQELKELTYSLKEDKGGTQMEDNQVVTPVVENEVPEEVLKNTENVETQDNVVSEVNPENDIPTEEFAKKDDEEEKNDDSNDVEEEKGSDEEDDKKEDEEEEPKKNHSLEEKFALLEKELEDLKQNYSALEEENKGLVEFKNAVEDAKKTELINSFYMLSDEDKKDVIENKSKYTLDDIEAKLSVICVRKKVNFNLESNSEEKEEQPAITYNLAADSYDDTPAWLKAVESHRNNK